MGYLSGLKLTHRIDTPKRNRMNLIDVKVRIAKPLGKSYNFVDGGSLYLLVNPNGSNYWRMK